MSELGWYHHIHGDDVHDLARYLAIKRVVRNPRCKLMDSRVFKKRTLCPCEPDIVFRHSEKGRETIWVVEIETRATSESCRMKNLQYEESLRGARLCIIDLSPLFRKDYVPILGNPVCWTDWTEIEKLISEMMPI